LNKQNLLEDAISDIQQLLKDTSMVNLQERTKELESYVVLLKHIPNLLDTMTRMPSEPSDSDDGVDLAHKPQGFPLERKLKGGILTTPDSEAIYVPESIIRSQSFLHGDIISANKISEKHYSFELLKRPESQPPTQRLQLNYGIVKERDGMLLVEEYIYLGQTKTVMVKDSNFAFRISEHEIREYSLSAGDIVDIAYTLSDKENGELMYKVIWKHDSAQVKYTSPEISGFYKTKSEGPSTTPLEGPDLDGKRVLMVGLEARKTVMRGIVERLNGIFEWSSGNEASIRYEAMVKRSDIIFAFAGHTSHAATTRAVEYCKKHNKLFIDTHTNGVDSFVSKLHDAANKLGLVIKTFK